MIEFGKGGAMHEQQSAKADIPSDGLHSFVADHWMFSALLISVAVLLLIGLVGVMAGREPERRDASVVFSTPCAGAHFFDDECQHQRTQRNLEELNDKIKESCRDIYRGNPSQIYFCIHQSD